MGTEPAVLGLLREHLERYVEGGAGPSLLFEALSAWGPRVPASFAEVVDLVHGPLRARLDARIGPSAAAEVVRAIERALRLAEMPTQDIVAVPRRTFDQEPTKTLARVQGTMRIVVLSASSALAARVGAVLDAGRVEVTNVSAERELASMPAGVHLALVDGADLPAISADAIAAALARIPLALIWCSDTALAAPIVAALERAKVRAMGFATSDPVDPMIDVLRSRLDTAHLPPPWLS